MHNQNAIISLLVIIGAVPFIAHSANLFLAMIHEIPAKFAN